MDNALVSVIIPAYNVAEYIPFCLDSIISQTYKNLEIICVNDGSTDSTLDIIKEYAEKDSRIIFIDKKNGGQASARNMGLDIAKGDYISFVDSDDYVSPDFIMRLKELLDSNSCDIARCRGRGVKTHDYEEPPLEKEPVITLRDTLQALRTFYDGVFYGWYADDSAVVWNCLYKSSVIGDLRFEEKLRAIEDEAFTQLVFANAGKIVYTDERLYFYYYRETSIMHSRVSDPDKDFELKTIVHNIRQNYFSEKGFGEICTMDAQAACDDYTDIYNSSKNPEIKENALKLFKHNYKMLSVKPKHLMLFNISPFAYKLAVKFASKKK
ncbi:MAG: glycosyltransferase [Acutalibacteraceae bacterium]